MLGFGGNNPHVNYGPGLYPVPLLVAASATADNTANYINVKSGMAVFDDLMRDTWVRTPATDSTDITIPAATLVGTHYVYANPTDAKDASGNDLDLIGIVPEADVERAAVNGSKGTKLGRSLVLAKLTLAAHTGTVTIAGTWANDDTATATIGGTAVQITVADDETSTAEVAEKLKTAINANATLAGKVLATRTGSVVTITSLTAVAYTLVAAEATAGDGTATRSAAALAGGGISAVDNTARFKFQAPPRGMGGYR